MINSTCGWDPQRHLTRHGACGRWVGFQPLPLPGYLPITPQRPYFHNGIAWCLTDYLSHFWRHVGGGIWEWEGGDELLETAREAGLEIVRPGKQVLLGAHETEGDVPLPKLPSLTELYSQEG